MSEQTGSLQVDCIYFLLILTSLSSTIQNLGNYIVIIFAFLIFQFRYKLYTL
jgi:hypothetical protein